MDTIRTGNLVAGQYRVDKKLGQGGFGTTYLAYDQALNDEVVIKILQEKWVQNPTIRQRFINEAQAMRRSRHPNVVLVYSLLLPENIPDLKNFCIVMEYLSGGSLEDHMRQGLTWDQSVWIISEVCQGLTVAHTLGIVHRDIKPSNILLSPNLEVVKIGDFGIAHLPDQSQMLTGAMHPGTLFYMAPEAFEFDQNKKIDGRADLYSLGVTLYQLLTGKEYLSFEECLYQAEREIRQRDNLGPYVDLSFMQQVECQALAQLHWKEVVCAILPPDPRDYNPQIPSSLAKIVMRALAKKPEERFPDPEVMAREMHKALAKGTPSTAPPPMSDSNWQVNAMIARSLEAVNQKQFSAALELIQQAVNLVPGNTRALATMANIQMARNDYAAAQQTWYTVLDLDPGYPEVYVKLGTCYNKTHQPEKAIEIQIRGLRRMGTGSSAALFHGLANSYYQAGRLEEAVWALERSLFLQPDEKLKPLLKLWKAELKHI